MTPICRFCGQAVITELPENCTQYEADELASKNCSCLAAQDYRKKLKAKEDAKKQIDELFGKCSDNSVISLMNAAIEMLSQGDIEKLSLSLSATTTAEIKIDAKGKYSITKTVTVKNKRETV